MQKYHFMQEITRQGITHLPDKLQAIKHIAVSINKKQLRSYIGGK